LPWVPIPDDLRFADVCSAHRYSDSFTGRPTPPIPSLPEVGPPVADQPFVSNPEIQGPDLLPIYYGYPMPSVVELTSTESPSEVPQSIIDPGVVGMTNVQSCENADTE